MVTTSDKKVIVNFWSVMGCRLQYPARKSDELHINPPPRPPNHYCPITCYIKGTTSCVGTGRLPWDEESNNAEVGREDLSTSKFTAKQTEVPSIVLVHWVRLATVLMSSNEVFAEVPVKTDNWLMNGLISRRTAAEVHKVPFNFQASFSTRKRGG